MPLKSCRVTVNKSIAALPSELPAPLHYIVDRTGFEPVTCRLTVEVSFIYDTCRLTSGFEPCSPHSQCGTLPIKLKSTFYIEVGFEPTLSGSKNDMLNHYTTQLFCWPGENRTHNPRFKRPVLFQLSYRPICGD